MRATSIAFVSSFVLLTVTALAGCSSSDSGGAGSGSGTAAPAPSSSSAAGSSDATPAGSQPAPAAAKHGVVAKLVLTADAQGMIALNPIQGAQSIAASKVVGTTLYAVVFPGGEQPGNAQPLIAGSGPVGSDLTATVTIPPALADGVYEMAAVISVSGKDPKNGPDPADLVAFSDPRDPLPAGDPPYTGQTIRFHVTDADAVVPMNNLSFIEYGAAIGGGK